MTKYVDMMEGLVQAVVTSKAFNKNWTKHPFRVIVSDEAFLSLCPVNYEWTWLAKNIRVNKGPQPPSGQEVEEPTPEPRYTGKSDGTEQSWSEKGMEIFNGCMVMIHLDRARK
jgi:hypothetical protein